MERLVADTGLVAPRVLDIGCGDGYLLGALSGTFAFREATGVDVNLTAELVKELSTARVKLQQELPPVAQQDYDLLLMLDVLEHVEDPTSLLGAIVSERMAPGGFAVITVPAFHSLFSEHDRKLRHFRRYSRLELAALGREAGLQVLASGYFFASLLPLRALSLVKERMGRVRVDGHADEPMGVGGWTGGAFSTRALTALLRADAQLCFRASRLGVTVPGLSAWLLCKK